MRKMCEVQKMKSIFRKLMSVTLVTIMLMGIMPMFMSPANAADPDVGLGFLLRGFNVLSGNELRNRNLETAPIFKPNAAIALAPYYDYYPFTESITNIRSGKTLYDLGSSSKFSLSINAGVEAGIDKLFKASAKTKYTANSAYDYKNSYDSYLHEFSLAHSVGKNTFNNINSPTTINALKNNVDAEFLDLLTDSTVSPKLIFDRYGTHFITSYEMGGYAETFMGIVNNRQRFSNAEDIRALLEVEGKSKVLSVQAAVELYESLATYQEIDDSSTFFSGRVVGGVGGLDYTGDPRLMNDVYNRWLQTFNPKQGSGFNCEILLDVRYVNDVPTTSLSMMGIWELLPNDYTARYNELVRAYAEMSVAQDILFFNDFVYKTVQPIGNLPRPDVDGAIIISTPEQLDNVRNNLSGKYILVNDIALTENWVPITDFSGILDGNGYAVKDVTINGAGQNLFGNSPGTFRNLVVSYTDRASFYSMTNGITTNPNAKVDNCYADLSFNETTATKYTYNNVNVNGLVNSITAKQAIVDLSAITNGQYVGDKKITIENSVDTVWFKGSLNSSPYLYVNFEVKGNTIVILENCYIDTFSSSIKFSGANTNPSIISIGRSNAIVGYSSSGSNAIIEAAGNLSILGTSDIQIRSNTANGQDAIRVAGTLDIALDGANFEARGGNGANGSTGSQSSSAGGTGGNGGVGGNGGNGVIANRLNILKNSNVYIYGGNGGNGGTGGQGGTGTAGSYNYNIPSGTPSSGNRGHTGYTGYTGGTGGVGGRGGNGGNGGTPLNDISYTKSTSSSLYLEVGTGGVGGNGGRGGTGGRGGQGGEGGISKAGGYSGNGGTGGRGGTGGVGGRGGDGGHHGSLAVVGGVSQNYGGAGGTGGSAGSGGSGGSGGWYGDYGPGSGCACFIGIHSCKPGDFGYDGPTGYAGSAGSPGTGFSGSVELSYLDPISSSETPPNLTGARLIIENAGNIIYSPGQVFNTSGLTLGLKQAGTLQSPISSINVNDNRVAFFYDFSKLGTTLVTISYYNNGEYIGYIPVMVVEPEPIVIQQKINVSSELGRAGAEVTLTASLVNNPGIASYSLTMVYPSELEFVRAEKGDILDSNFRATTTVAGQVSVSATSEDGTDVSDGTVLFTVTFKVVNDVKDGVIINEDTGLVLGTFRSIDAVESDGKRLPCVFNQGQIVVRNTLYGDVNGDGRIDFLDVTRLLRYLWEVDTSPLGPKQLAAPMALFMSLDGFNAPALKVSDEICQAGDEVTMTVSLTNNPGIASFSLSLEYPDELSFIEAKAGDIISSNFKANADNAGVVAVSATSENGVDVTTGTILFTVRFKVSEETKADCIDGVSLGLCRPVDAVESDGKRLEINIEQGSIIVEKPSAVLVRATASAKDFIGITETSKNSGVWALAFKVTEVYSNGETKIVHHVINIKANNANVAGSYDLDAYTLIYDIKGNGSNIKEFRLDMNYHTQ